MCELAGATVLSAIPLCVILSALRAFHRWFSGFGGCPHPRPPAFDRTRRGQILFAIPRIAQMPAVIHYTAWSSLTTLPIVCVFVQHDKNDDDAEKQTEKKPKPGIASRVLCPERKEGCADKQRNADTLIAGDSVLQTGDSLLQITLRRRSYRQHRTGRQNQQPEPKV